MQRTEAASTAARPSPDLTRTWQARRWYYTPGSRRPYSVRQASAGDRRLLAAFALELTRTAQGRDLESLQELTRMLFERVLAAPGQDGAGFVALENTDDGDRVIGISAYAREPENDGEFCVAVAEGFRGEQVGRTLLSSLVRHARHVGVPQLQGEMLWSNRAMQVLATSLGFTVEASAQDRSRRRLMLALK